MALSLAQERKGDMLVAAFSDGGFYRTNEILCRDCLTKLFRQRLLGLQIEITENALLVFASTNRDGHAILEEHAGEWYPDALFCDACQKMIFPTVCATCHEELNDRTFTQQQCNELGEPICDVCTKSINWLTARRMT